MLQTPRGLRLPRASRDRSVNGGESRGPIRGPPRWTNRSIDMQVTTCLSSAHGRPVQGARGSDAAHDPRRAGRSRRPDPVRDLHPPDHEARHRRIPAGDLPAPRRARGRRARQDRALGPIQVPPPRHHAAARDRGALAAAAEGVRPMKIVTTSVLVDDQAKALTFYTDVLGFAKKTDMPAGEHRWL